MTQPLSQELAKYLQFTNVRPDATREDMVKHAELSSAVSI